MQACETPLFRALEEANESKNGAWADVKPPAPCDSKEDPFWAFRRRAIGFARNYAGYEKTLVNRTNPTSTHAANGLSLRMELESAADIGGLEKIEFDIFSLTLEARCDFDRKELSAALEAVKMLDRLSGTLLPACHSCGTALPLRRTTLSGLS